MKILNCALVLSFALCCSARAAETSPPPVAAVQSAPSARSLELVKRYLVAVHFDAVVDRMVGILMPAMMKLATDHDPDLSAEQKADLTKAAEHAMAEWHPKYVERLEVEIARIFTDDELQAALTFYESPLERSMIAKQAAMSDAAVRLSAEMSPELKKLMLEEVCKTLDCSKPKQPLSAKKS